MNVAIQLEFKAGRKEPLGDLIRRVAAAFDRANATLFLPVSLKAEASTRSATRRTGSGS
jgi:hypothetical protein